MNDNISSYFRLSVNMKKYFFFFLTSIFLSLVLSAQELQVKVTYVTEDATEKKPLIYYSPLVKLTWADFKGKPVLSSNAAAITNAGIGFKMTFHSQDNVTTLYLTVNCNFYISDSWVKDGKRTPYILNHEQHHFDVSYIAAGIFMNKIKNTVLTTSNCNLLLQRVYKDCCDIMNKMQDDYDGQTMNGQLEEKQQKWNIFFSDKLPLFTK